MRLFGVIHPLGSIGSHLYGDIRPLGSVSSHFWVSLGMQIHWDPSVPISMFIWGHPSTGIHQFPFLGLFRDADPLVSIGSSLHVPLGTSQLQSHCGTADSGDPSVPIFSPIGIHPDTSVSIGITSILLRPLHSHWDPSQRLHVHLGSPRSHQDPSQQLCVLWDLPGPIGMTRPSQKLCAHWDCSNPIGIHPTPLGFISTPPGAFGITQIPLGFIPVPPCNLGSP